MCNPIELPKLPESKHGFEKVLEEGKKLKNPKYKVTFKKGHVMYSNNISIKNGALTMSFSNGQIRYRLDHVVKIELVQTAKKKK